MYMISMDAVRGKACLSINLLLPRVKMAKGEEVSRESRKSQQKYLGL
jgi:hypothetical protein